MTSLPKMSASFQFSPPCVDLIWVSAFAETNRDEFLSSHRTILRRLAQDFSRSSTFYRNPSTGNSLRWPREAIAWTADIRCETQILRSPGFATPIALTCDRGPKHAPLRMTSQWRAGVGDRWSIGVGDEGEIALAAHLAWTAKAHRGQRSRRSPQHHPRHAKPLPGRPVPKKATTSGGSAGPS
jgi:hypothetical protein